jgi:hypothetical protein
MKSPLFNGGWHENWDIANFLSDLMTTSHAWCSGPTALLPQKVLGVEPISAGWQTFSVSPNPCDLKWAKGIVPSPYGSICVDWENDPDGIFKLYVLVPDKTKAKISIPGSNPDKVRINNLALGRNPNIKLSGTENGKIVFFVPPGEYEFSITNE